MTSWRDFVCDLELWRLAGFAGAASLLWAYYVDSKDRLNKEPRRLLAVTFALGVAAGALCLLINEFLDRTGNFPDFESSNKFVCARWCLCVVGPMEEGSKVLFAFLCFYRWKDFDELVDGYVYASCLALGFGAIESVFTLRGGGSTWWAQLGGVFALPFAHSLFSAPWGFALAFARLKTHRPRVRWLVAISGILASMILHGLYDCAILVARSPVLVGLLAFCLWFGAAWYLRTL